MGGARRRRRDGPRGAELRSDEAPRRAAPRRVRCRRAPRPRRACRGRRAGGDLSPAPRRSGSRSGAWRPHRRTRPSANSSAGRSGSSRRSSIAAPTCSWRPRRRGPRSWDAARCLDDPELEGRDISFGAALALAPAAAFRCAKDTVQVLGGIGYTWEHDAHVYLRRATALSHLLPPAATAREQVAAAVGDGSSRRLSIELPPEAQPIRVRSRPSSTS